MKNIEKKAELFQVEELQERLEFGGWSASASGGYESEGRGAYGEATITYEWGG